MDDNEGKVGALLLWALMGTADQDLAKFRRQRLGRSSTVELEHLRKVQAISRALVVALRNDRDIEWQQIEGAWKVLAETLQARPPDLDDERVAELALEHAAQDAEPEVESAPEQGVDAPPSPSAPRSGEEPSSEEPSVEEPLVEEPDDPPPPMVRTKTNPYVSPWSQRAATVLSSLPDPRELDEIEKSATLGGADRTDRPRWPRQPEPSQEQTVIGVDPRLRGGPDGELSTPLPFVAPTLAKRSVTKLSESPSPPRLQRDSEDPDVEVRTVPGGTPATLAKSAELSDPSAEVIDVEETVVNPDLEKLAQLAAQESPLPFVSPESQPEQQPSETGKELVVEETATLPDPDSLGKLMDEQGRSPLPFDEPKAKGSTLGEGHFEEGEAETRKLRRHVTPFRQEAMPHRAAPTDCIAAADDDGAPADSKPMVESGEVLPQFGLAAGSERDSEPFDLDEESVDDLMLTQKIKRRSLKDAIKSIESDRPDDPPRADSNDGPRSALAIPPMSLERYAAFCAECATFPERIRQLRVEYGLRNEDAHERLDEWWQKRFDNKPAMRQQWEALCDEFTRALRKDD